MGLEEALLGLVLAGIGWIITLLYDTRKVLSKLEDRVLILEQWRTLMFTNGHHRRNDEVDENGRYLD